MQKYGYPDPYENVKDPEHWSERENGYDCARERERKWGSHLGVGEGAGEGGAGDLEPARPFLDFRSQELS